MDWLLLALLLTFLALRAMRFTVRTGPRARTVAYTATPVPTRPRHEPTYPTKLKGATGGETRRARLAVQRSREGAALYKAWRANPADLVVRSALADWLIEHGFDGTAARLMAGDGRRETIPPPV